MKRKILVVCIISVLSATTSVYSSTRKVAPTYNKIILDFIDSQVNSDYHKLDLALNENACFKLPRGEKILMQSKSNLVDQMKNDKGIKQNCDSKYEVLAKSDAMVIARIDFKYDNCTQHDFLIIEKNDDREWKITQVCKMFEDAKEQEPETTGNATASN